MTQAFRVLGAALVLAGGFGFFVLGIDYARRGARALAQLDFVFAALAFLAVAWIYGIRP
jgi:hypothetical protein